MRPCVALSSAAWGLFLFRIWPCKSSVFSAFPLFEKWAEPEKRKQISGKNLNTPPLYSSSLPKERAGKNEKKMGISRKISSRKRRERKRIKAELRNNLEYFLYISLHFYAYFSPFSFFFLFLSNRFGEKRERDWKGLESLWEPRQNLISISVLSTFYPRKKWEESEKKSSKNPPYWFWFD